MEKRKYHEVKSSSLLNEFISSYWMHRNDSDSSISATIVPDGHIKILLFVNQRQITKYFLTGIWVHSIDVYVPPFTTVYGIRMKILSPEFLLKREVASIINTIKYLDLSFLSMNNLDITDFASLIEHWENELIKTESYHSIPKNKILFSNLIYKRKGDIPANEVSKTVFWTSRQINRYLNKYIGISLKKYLNILKCYDAFDHVSEGRFYPEKNYFDQSHFIREVKKYTGEIPSKIFQQQNDRFIQLSNCRKK